MRSRSIAAVMLVSLAAVSTASAQGATADPNCKGPSADACQQAVDFFAYMAPLIGTAMTGGNTTLAQGGNLGGPRFGLVPRFAIGVRVNAVMGNVPDYKPQAPSSASASAPPPASRQLTTSTAIIPMPAVDLAVGVFGGVPLALTSVGGVDLLLSATYVPKYSGSSYSITPDKAIQFGYGARVGLLQEGLLVPGVGVSFMSRKFPKTTLTASDNGSSLTVKDLDLSSNAWRLTVSKSLIFFGIAAGVGQDMYKASTSLSATSAAVTTPIAIGSQTSGPFNLSSKVTRTNFFADLSMNLVILKIVASGGMVTGGEIPTYNTFDNAANKSRVYGSVGLRIGL